MTSPMPADLPDGPDVAPDVAVKVQEFAELVAGGQPVAATTAMVKWVNDCPEEHDDDRTRYFATTAVTLVATRVRAGLDQQRCDYAVLRPETQTRRSRLVVDPHDWAMCQVVVRIANGEHGAALDLLNAHKLVHGTAGLFWLGTFAVCMLADLLVKERTP